MATATKRRIRLDLLLVERGLAESRARAQAMVMAGQVKVGEGDAARADLKSGDLVPNDAQVAVSGGSRWVSRGAHKLIAALDAFGIDVTGPIVKDNEWFTEHIVVKGKTVTISLNGKQVVEWTQPDDWNGGREGPGRTISHGTIAFQGHDPKSIVQYKNVQIKILK